MQRKKFTRNEMLDLVWSAPMRTVAASLGLSDVGLKKAALKAGVPTPPRDQLRRAQVIRTYVAEATSLHIANTGASNDPTLERWRAWAFAQADRIDPVKNGRFIQSLDDLG